MRVTLIIAAALAFASPTFAADIYVAQASAGGNTGADCADARAVSTLAAGDWTAGNTIHFCGTITSTVSAQGSGTVGNVITVKFEVGASQVLAGGCGAGGCLNFNGRSYILVDGGVPCGYINQNDVTSCNGSITATGVGSGASNASSVAIYARGGGTGIEVRNLLIANMYVHNSTTDVSASGQNIGFWTDGTSMHVHNCVFHDNETDIKGEAGTNHSEFDHNIGYNTNHSMFLSGPATNTPNSITQNKIHDYHYHDWSNWDTTTDTYHHDGVFLAGNNNLANGISFTQVYNGLLNGVYTNCSVNCMTAPIFFNDTNNTSVFNNIIVSSSGQFVFNGLIFSWSPGTAQSNTLIANNTILGDPGGGNGYCVSIEGDASMTFENNVISNCNQLIHSYTSPNTIYTAIDYNLYQATSLTNVWQKQAATYSTIAAWRTAIGGETHSTAQTTALTLPAPLYRQQGGSPLIGAGVNLTSLSISALDADTGGNARPGGSTVWDLGAWYGTASANTPVLIINGNVVINGTLTVQ